MVIQPKDVVYLFQFIHLLFGLLFKYTRDYKQLFRLNQDSNTNFINRLGLN